jgi:hypothetical protein
LGSLGPVTAASLLLLITRTFHGQYTLMLSLELVRPDGSLSVAFSCTIMAKRQSESVLAGNSDDRQQTVGTRGGDCWRWWGHCDLCMKLD